MVTGLPTQNIGQGSRTSERHVGPLRGVASRSEALRVGIPGIFQPTLETKGRPYDTPRTVTHIDYATIRVTVPPFPELHLGPWRPLQRSTRLPPSYLDSGEGYRGRAPGTRSTGLRNVVPTMTRPSRPSVSPPGPLPTRAEGQASTFPRAAVTPSVEGTPDTDVPRFGLT